MSLYNLEERDMLAELAAANAAFDVIKQTIQNGQEIYAAGQALADYFGMKAEIQKKAHEHGYKSDLEAFMATEQLKSQEDELKQMMVWQGRGGMWEDWLSFQAETKRSREQAEEEAREAKKKRKKALINGLIITGISVFSFGVIGGFLYLVLTFGK